MKTILDYHFCKFYRQCYAFDLSDPYCRQSDGGGCRHFDGHINYQQKALEERAKQVSEEAGADARIR